jgi:MFS transporter, DHA1 family, multidrug resistance protein
MPEGATSPGDRPRLVLLLGALVALAPLTTDMYLPALPAITSETHTSPAAVQLTLTAALAGLALGQLLAGPLSDVIGRRTPLLAGVAVHIVASVLCLLAPDLAVLDVLRVLQGVGAAAATVITMAVVRDLFEGAAAARVLSRLMLILGVSPILAPTLGGIVLAWSSWRGVFAVLAALSLVVVAAAAFALPETLPVGRRRTGGLASTCRDVGRLSHDRTFVGLILLTGLAMSTIFAFVSGSPFVFQKHFGLSEQEFGYAFGVGALGLVLATQLNVRLLRRRSPAQVLVGSLAAAVVAGGLLLVCAATGAGGMAGTFVPLWLVLFTVGLTMPNAPALALSRHGEVAGTAAALLGAVQFGLGAVTAPLVGTIGTGPAAMASVIALTLAVAAGILVAVVRPWRLTAPAPR